MFVRKAIESGQMTPKESLFVAEYLVSLNAAGAYRKAGYSSKGANVEARKTLKKPHIAAEIARRLEERHKRLEIDADALLRRAIIILTADPRELWASTSEHADFAMAGGMTFSGAQNANGLRPARRRSMRGSRSRVVMAGLAIISRIDQIRNARSVAASGCRMLGSQTHAICRLKRRYCLKA